MSRFSLYVSLMSLSVEINLIYAKESKTRINPSAPIVLLDSKFYADSMKLCKQLLNTWNKYKAASVEYNQKLREVMKMVWERVVQLVIQKLGELSRRRD